MGHGAEPTRGKKKVKRGISEKIRIFFVPNIT
jgi:hypothetical protein